MLQSAILIGPLALIPSLGAAQSGPMPTDTIIQELVARVSPDSVLASIRRLQAFRTRTSQSESCRAAVDWTLDRMRAYGCDSAYADEFDTAYDASAVGIKIGHANPRRVYIICGHIDDWCDPPDVAPGADDNASGATAVLEACRVFRGHDFDCTVRFICFNAEENGTIGSCQYAWHASTRGDSILGVLNFDMISHGDSGYDSMLVLGHATRPNCSLLVNTYCALGDSYAQLRCRQMIRDSISECSDEYWFWFYLYPAIDVHEVQYPPSHHTLLDSVGPYRYTYCGTNNVPLAAEAIRAGVATLARLAGARPLAVAESNAGHPPGAGQVSCTPNPFRDKVDFRLATVGRHASIRIYNISGQVVRTIPVSPFSTHNLRFATWDGRNSSGGLLPSGVYYYRVSPGNGVGAVQLIR